MRRRFILSSSAQQYPNAPLPNQVTSRATFLSFTDAINNTWQGRFNPIKMGNGNWMGIWVEGTNHSDYNSASHYVNISFSNDEGATWTANNTKIGGGAVTGFPLVPPGGGATGFVDFNLIKCPNNDLIIIAQNRGSNPTVWNGVNFSQHQYRSTDNGETWTYEYDWCDHIGENTVDLRAKIQGHYENMVVGSTVYVMLCQIRTDLDDTRIQMYKSTDNCTTWSFVSNPVEYDEASPDCTESSIADLGNGIFFCVFRTQDLSTAVWKRSENSGLTWGVLTDFGPIVGYVGVHQPRVLRFANFFMLMGRDYKNVPVDPNSALHSRSAFWTTTDLFSTLSRRQYLDPWYAGNGSASPNNGDSGYTKGLLKSDGSFMFFGYWGTSTTASIYKYDASNTGSPSTENISNIDFLPSTLSASGARLQMNRDNFFDSTTSPVLGGLAVMARFHNTLGTGNSYWLASGTNRPEITILNDRGWAIFDGTARLESVTSIGNTLFRNSFSVGFWLWPDDGQPAATQMIFRDSSRTDTIVDDRVQIHLQTDGRLQANYAINATAVSLITANPVFADGVVATPVHVAVTLTSGGLMRLYVDGVIDANTGNIAALTMASYTTVNQTHIAQRQTGASTWDLPYSGKLREVMVQPVVWSAGDITNIMLN